MRLIILLFSILFFLNSFAQDIKVDTAAIDTLHLSEVKAKKIVAYRFNSTTFYVSYKEYLKAETAFWKLHKNDMKYEKAAKKNGGYINQEAVKNRLIFDSSYKDIKHQAKKGDTIFVFRKSVDASVYPLENNFISDQLDKNKCAIKTGDGKWQRLIIRIKCSWYHSSRSAWYGRRYFFPGSVKYFLLATDLISYAQPAQEFHFFS